MRRFVLAVLLVAIARPASAQLFEISSTHDSIVTSFGASAAYDPVHDCYFVVATVVDSGSQHKLIGRFLNRSGAALGTVTMDTFPVGGAVSAVTYSPDISDGAGGFGGFVVVWPSGGSIAAQGVAFPGRLVGSKATVTGPGFAPTRLAVAYSPVQRVCRSAS